MEKQEEVLSPQLKYYYDHLDDPGFRQRYNQSRVIYYINNRELERERSRIRYYTKQGRPVPPRKDST